MGNRVASAPLVAREPAGRPRGAQSAHPPGHGRGSCRRTEREQPDARVCYLRYRRVTAISNFADNPKLTGKAITVVVVGLACGMGSWAMAVFVTGFTWLLV